MKNYVIHLGLSGFPRGNAAMQRIKMTFKSLQRSGFNVLIISKRSVHKAKENSQRLQRFEGIPYVQTSFKLNRPDSIIKRNFNKLSGFIGEFFLLLKFRKKINSALVYTPSFAELLYYRVVARMFSFKIILVYVEYRSSIPERKKGFTRLNDLLFDNHCHRLCDSAIVISEYLKDHLAAKSSTLPLLKIPAITDFAEFRNVVPAQNKNGYLMYCGTINYVEVISFILDIFIKVKQNTTYKGELILVLSGDVKENWEILNEKIAKSSYKENIIINSNIPYDTLVSYYLGADALLIPLRDSVQDIARFPHKISEYTAAGRPIISTNIGELKYYFSNKESAILADDYTVESYFNSIKEIIGDKEVFNKIGNSGYRVGLENFEYSAYDEKLKSFILSLQD